MAAGPNLMVARQSKMAIKNQNTELKHTHINLAVLIRHSLNTRIQSLRKPPIETENFGSKY